MYGHILTLLLSTRWDRNTPLAFAQIYIPHSTSPFIEQAQLCFYKLLYRNDNLKLHVLQICYYLYSSIACTLQSNISK